MEPSSRRFSVKQMLAILVGVLVIVAAIIVFVLALGKSDNKEGEQKDEPYEAYTLFAPFHNKTTFLVDNQGRLRHTWEAESFPGLSSYLLEDGNLLRSTTLETSVFKGEGDVGAGAGGGAETLDWDGNVEWKYELASDTQIQHHDIFPMSNGNVLMLGWEVKTRDEAIAAGVDPANVDPATNSTWSEFIVEVDPDTDEIVWEWHLWDHLVQDHDESKANSGNISENPQLVNANYYKNSNKPDWIHANGINYNADLDQIVISAQKLSEVWIIDHSTSTEEAASHEGGNAGRGGDLLYRYGNPEVYGAGTSEDRQLFLQHYPNWIADGLPGQGNMLIFNNGDPAAERMYSSVLEIKPTYEDGVYQQNSNGVYETEVVWEYTAPNNREDFFAPFISGAQRLPNGNTLITNGPAGVAFEITSEGKTVWRFASPITDQSRIGPPRQAKDVFRFTKYPVSYPAFQGKDIPPRGETTYTFTP